MRLQRRRSFGCVNANVRALRLCQQARKEIELEVAQNVGSLSLEELVLALEDDRNSFIYVKQRGGHVPISACSPNELLESKKAEFQVTGLSRVARAHRDQAVVAAIESSAQRAVKSEKKIQVLLSGYKVLRERGATLC